MNNLPKTLLCLLLVIPCCGCLPATQLEQRAIVQAAAVDYADDRYNVTLQLFDPSANAENAGGDAYLVKELIGTTLTQAFEQASQNGREIYLGSCQLLAVGKESSNRLREVLDYFNSRPQTRATMMVVCANGNAADLLKVGDGKYKPMPSAAAEQILQLAEKEKRILPCRLKDILAALETDGWDTLLPLMGTSGQGQEAKLELVGSVAFSGSLPTTELTPQETAVLGWSRQGKGNILLNLTDNQNDEPISILLEDFSPKLSAATQNGQLHLRFSLKTKGRISEGTGLEAGQPNKQQMEALQAAAQQEITQQLQSLLKKLCALGCDPLRFGERLQRSHPQEWNHLKENWNKALAEAQPNIQIECELTTFSGKSA